MPVFRVFLFLLLSSAFGSCALFKPRCPIESCKVRMIHSHKDIYKHMDIKKVRRENLRKRKEEEKHHGENGEEASDSTDTGETGVVFTTRRHSIESIRSRRKKKKQDEEGENSEESATGGGETASGSGTSGEEEAKPKKKKKKKTTTNRWFMKRHPVTNPKFLFIPIKRTEKYGMGGEVKPKLWRSRVTPWWKNQRPKVGQQWKKPKKE